MRSALILAAGCGTRIRPVLPDAPKGFLTLGAKPIIEESFDRLSDAGISDIVVVTGYGANYYETLAKHWYGQVRLVHNELFAESGSLYSLYCARRAVNPPFLLLESDIIYEPRALTELIRLQAPDGILLSGRTNAGDEVFVETKSGFLKDMSKKRAALGDQIAGELVGICKISVGLLDELMNAAESLFEESIMRDYEIDGLVRAARRINIPCPVVDSLVWAEIDDEDQLRRAREDIYPALLRPNNTRQHT